ncbi:uncharacterized protein LOC124186653 [Neodiprion fabricii]|uniref:uncharacterized protein LOC124186653 n=1 Tax=Neodiprion fabricii TaxID=2872261 RepID=UPI001ED93BBC|nr:uncharacterized protein LOC124186653 [Neodiprion fabricii]
MGPKGSSTYVRALLDQGSESSFASEPIVQLLGLSRRRASVTLSGLGSTETRTVTARTQLVLRSRDNPKFEFETDALVLPKLTSRLPSDRFGDLDLQQFEGLTLTDPDFSVSQNVDLILGADVYGQLLRPGLKRFPTSQLVAQGTAFGWVISGMVLSDKRLEDRTLSSLPTQALHCTVELDLEQTLQRFWSLEEIAPNSSKLRPEDEIAEHLFKETYSCDSRSRYEVRLSVKPDRPRVANETRSMALKSLSSMQRQFSRDARLAEAYGSFMRDYERLGRMTRLLALEIRCEDAWYLPHHAVIQASGDKWKLRVVFDAPRKTREGHCLNDFLWAGPPLQSDLSLILLNWRKYRFAFTADIVNIFRQVLVKCEDQDLQRIVWAPTADASPVDYRLHTVTYGTTCAPYLAIRMLSQLVIDKGEVNLPLGAECLKAETYVDDTFAGAEDLSTAVQKRLELIELLRLGGLELDKWSANHPDLLPPQARQNSPKEIDGDALVKTFGTHWIPSQDDFKFRAADVEEMSTAATKRFILSNVARLFDPLGWLAPITVTAKVLMHDLWIQKCYWDSPLPAEFRERWHTHYTSLTQLPPLSIHRWLGVASSRSYQIHGFSDASPRSYAAVAYLRINEENGRFSVLLLAAKNKVAPVKTISIPNLELCGAALLG